MNLFKIIEVNPDTNVRRWDISNNLGNFIKHVPEKDLLIFVKNKKQIKGTLKGISMDSLLNIIIKDVENQSKPGTKDIEKMKEGLVWLENQNSIRKK
jgi:small nuclear ribonucleoprotein (snRNP)-like protein